MTEVGLAEIERQWTQLTGERPPPELLRAYFPRLEAADGGDRDARGLAASAIAHHRAALRRSGDVPVIEIRNPGPEDAENVGNRTVINTVATDRRYLLSALTVELNKRGLAIRAVRHPIITVQRGSQGLTVIASEHLSRTLGDTIALPVISAEDGAGLVTESWVHLEVDRIPETEFAAVEAGLRSAIEFVDAVDRDRERMASTARRIARQLRESAPRPELAAEAAESADLLDWLDGRFAFMGYREYLLDHEDGEQVLRPVEDTALGISSLRPTSSSPLSRAVARKALEPRVLVLTKANSRSTLIRRGFMDYVGVKTFDEHGRIIGEKRFVGLYTSRMYSASVREIPVVREKIKHVLRHSGLSRYTHSGNELQSVLERFPRDDLFHADPEEILDVVMQVVDLQEKRQSSVFIRRDPYERYVSVLLYLPRDLYDTAARNRVEQVLCSFYGAQHVDFDVLLSDSALARLHFVARVPRDEVLPDIDPEVVAARIKGAVRSWEEDVSEHLAPSGTALTAEQMERNDLWARAFPAGYREYHSPQEAVSDISRFEDLHDDSRPVVSMYRPAEPDPAAVRLRLYRISPAGLSDILPHLSDLGAEVLDERPYELDLGDGSHRYLYDFGLQLPSAVSAEDYRRIEAAFSSGWTGQRETGGMDRLIVSGLSWQDVSILRSFTHYLRQTGFFHTERHMGQVFTSHPDVAELLVQHFHTRFDPDIELGGGSRDDAMADLRARITSALAAVASLDADRVLRAVLALIDAIVRTNAFQPTDGSLPATLVYKIRTPELAFVPLPRPALEMWVYSPRVEGVHLRYGPVARGGLRWSDRPDDFRTEVLGLVKAQTVKNALIVPTGAKGGFCPKQLPDPAVDREAWAAVGQSAYEEFIGALLDVTDDLRPSPAGDEVVHPARTVIHDGADSYLVVAADKGTAQFSDVANAIAQRRGFWLGDAFASGGSVGYDHKAMGITARGAWKSVERHFRELGLDTSDDEFTVVGIGDMSGDVFGNGMLRSDRIRLVAAFDHRDIFLDPNPDAARSFAERARLYDIPRSSWQDYDADLLSEGGGIHSRSAKSIELSPHAAAALGMPQGAYTPTELIRGILQAPVDLLYNGGIGTYVKAASETHEDVGDKAGDAVRIDGGQLRVRVVGEGGNLGFTQLGRVEAALAGVRLNTDAVDNSAGVDASDHEVNIKLMLNALIERGRLPAAAREQTLRAMTDEVADLVLANNYSQNIALGEARDRAQSMSSTQRRLLAHLEEHAGLDRAVEFLPDDKALARRSDTAGGFTSPELAVMLAYTKMDAVDQVLASDVPDEDWALQHLAAYFPASLAAEHADAFVAHPLRREIATAKIVNRMVDRGGLTYIYRLQEETGAAVPHIARVFAVVTAIFDLDEHFEQICALDHRVDAEVQVDLLHGWVRLLDRASRWIVHQAPDTLSVTAEIERYRSGIRDLRPRIQSMLRGEDRAELEDAAHARIARGVPQDVAFRAAGLLDEFALLDVVQAAARTGTPGAEVAEIYYAVTDLLSGPALLKMIERLERGSRWTAQARGAMRDDFYQAVIAMVLAVLQSTDSERTEPVPRADDRIAQWRARNDTALRQVLDTIAEVRALDSVDHAPMSVLLRMMRSVVRSTVWRSENA